MADQNAALVATPPTVSTRCETPQTSFHEALRVAIHARGLSLERLQAKLAQRGIQVSLASLSNWQRGKCRPEGHRSLRAVHALEDILGLPRDELRMLLGPPRPRGRWPAALPFDALCPAHESLERLLRRVKGLTDRRQRLLSYHEFYQLGRENDERSIYTCVVLQARAQGIDRYVAIHHSEQGAAMPELGRTRFCRPGRVRTDPAAGLTVAELLFDHPLAYGETYIVEYEFAHSPRGPFSTHYTRGFRFPTHKYLLQVQFDPAAVPSRCYSIWRPNLATPCSDVRELRLSRWNTVHLAEPDIQPGVYGIRWDWD